MADDKVSVEISIEERAALKALTQLSRGLDNFEKQAVASVKKSDGAFDSFRGNLAALATSGAIKAIASGLLNIANSSINASATAETLQTKLEVLTGSAEKASQVFQDLSTFAAKTPFQLTDITEATSQLLAFGFSTEEALNKIKNIGEISAGSGKSLSELTQIFGQISGSGKLTAERLNQLEEAAVPIGQAIADTMGIAKESVRDFVSRGQISFADFEKAFNSLAQEGGLFAGSLEKQSNTLNGALSNLDDTLFNVGVQLGDTFKPAIVEGARALTGVLEDFSKALKENEEDLKAVGSFLKDYVVTYASLAVSAVKAEKPIDELNKKIEENVNLAQQLISRKKDLEDDKGAFFGIFDEATQQSIENVNNLLRKNQGELNLLIAERKKLQGETFAKEDTEELRGAQAAYEAEMQRQSDRIAKESSVNAQILQDRMNLETQLALLQEDKKLKEAEAKLADQELLSSEREQILSEIEAYEINKSNIQLNAQKESNKLILDETNRKLANDKASAEASLRVRESEIKKKQALDAQYLRDRQTFYSTAASLSQSSSKELQAIGKAAGLAQIAIATPPAIASSFNYGTKLGGPPLGFVFAGIAAAAQAEQAKRLLSFESGGVVGGFTGATSGRDNTIANVRTGEMVLNASQQRQLFDVATGQAEKPNSDRMIEITSIVQVDEREIARAVRNQRLEGFV